MDLEWHFIYLITTIQIPLSVIKEWQLFFNRPWGAFAQDDKIRIVMSFPPANYQTRTF